MSRLVRLGAHSMRQASISVWHLFFTDTSTEYLPAWPGKHRVGVAPGTDTQRKAWGLPIDPWPDASFDQPHWADAFVWVA